MNLTEKAFNLFKKAKHMAVMGKSMYVSVPFLEGAFIILYKDCFIHHIDADIFCRAGDNIVDNIAAAEGRDDVSEPCIDKELSRFVASKNSSEEAVGLPEIWDFIVNSPNATCKEPLFEQENIDAIRKDLQAIESGKETLEEDPDSFNWMDYCEDLVEKVRSYNKPFIGREDVIEDSLRTLARMDKCNPVYVGEPGVGKTAVTLGLAKKIADGNVPDKLKNASLLSVDLAAMVAGSVFRGQFEERFKAVLEGVSEKYETPILFFDEIHTIVGAGSSSQSSMDASNILKPYLTEGKIKFIGATTYAEYRQYIEKDKAFARRFQKIDVAEPSIPNAIKIISGLKDAYGKYHNVTYTKDAIEASVKLSAKYINDRYLPDKAIDLIDEAGAQHVIHPELGKKVGKKDIEEVLSRICNIPKITNEKEDFKTVKMLPETLRKTVFGQEKAIDAISEAIKLSKSGLTDTEKPIGSFLFVGPSGVGKTELAKQIAKDLNISFVRFDMSEFQEKHSVSNLIGAPAGYVGYEDGGILTEAIRKTPHCVILFDEIEKAHPDIYKTFLQIMDYGTLTDNKGRKADFRNAIVIMTSNAGATVAAKKSLGFNSQNDSEVNTNGITDAVNETFSPEFRNRLTDIIIFNGIDEKIGSMVVEKELKALLNKLKSRKIEAKFSQDCIKQLTEMGVSPVYGARGIQRVVDSEIRKLFADAIINGENLSNCEVDYDGKSFIIKKGTLIKHV